jgi:hypothetical protein
LQVGSSKVLDFQILQNIFTVVNPTIKQNFANGLTADFSHSACFVEGSLDEDRLRCTLLPDGTLGKIMRAFSFKNAEKSGSPNHMYTSCDGMSIGKSSMIAWWKNKRGLDLADVDIILEVW